jgi:septum formation protein
MVDVRSPLVLASASPQRRKILERLEVPFTTRPTGVAELDQGDPGQVAVENALRKARAACAGGAFETVLGVDTLVALDGRIFGKPANREAARETIATLAGETHVVFSGVALLQDGREQTALAKTEVLFRACDEDTVNWYVASGEWREKSGGYAIQGRGAALVREIRGEYENVVGLPLATLLDLCPALLRSRARRV